MKTKHKLIYSVTISVLAHILFFSCAVNIKIPGAYTILTRTKRFFNIKTIEDERLKKSDLVKRETVYIKPLRFQSPVYSESILSPIKDLKREEKKPDPSLELRQETITEPVKITKEFFDELLNDKDYKPIIEGSVRRTEAELVEIPRLSGKEGVAQPKEMLAAADIPSEFVNKMPGFTPAKIGGFLDSTRRKAAYTFGKSYTPAVRRTADFQDLREYLSCELFAYEDPEDGQKYFKISIRAGKDGDQLSRMPKEIVFLIDCSLSIQQKRLREFKRGIEYCLKNLRRLI
ncbi:hypothetical protein ACFL0T_07395 [Candidatus Omnitrophota bacterium]